MALTGGPAILARLRSQREAKKPTVVITYASQTGTGQDIAQGINGECKERGISSKVLSLNDLKLENVNSKASPVLIALVSTTGDGDPPDNSIEFFKSLTNATRGNNSDLFKGVKYTCLGLGDSNFTSYMAVPTRFKKAFDELGAERFYECREVDEVDEFEDLIDGWVEGLWDNVKSALSEVGSNKKADSAGSTSANKREEAAIAKKIADLEIKSDSLAEFRLPEGLELQGVPAAPVVSFAVELSDNKPDRGSVADPIASEDGGSERFLASISSCEKLTADWSDREVYLLTFDLDGSGMTYVPGDSLSIMPENDPDLVERLLTRLEIDGSKTLRLWNSDDANATSPLRPICSVRDYFTKKLELSGVLKKTMLRFLAEHCSEAQDANRLKYLVSKPGKEAYHKLILSSNVSLIDLLTCIPSCKPPLGGLIQLMPPLSPRPYSIANYEQISGPRVRVAFSLAKIETPYGERTGVATGWLKRVIHSDQPRKVPLCVRSGGAFRLPEDLAKPLVLIGPGTGIVPFVGFLEQKRELSKKFEGSVGACWVFFGCRKPDEDYLFHSDLEAFQKEGTIKELRVAFSRVGENKVYVQHLMANNSELLYKDIFENEGFVFVCGDGAGMAQGVHKCLIDIFMKHGKSSEDEAKKRLDQKLRNFTYVRDIWS